MHSKGFTIVEMLIYVGVSTIVLLSVTALMFTTLSAYAQARIHQSHQIALHDALQTFQNLIEETYATTPSSDIGVDLAQPGTDVTFLSQDQGNDIRFYMSSSVLYAEQNNNGGVALHSASVPFTTCIINDTSGGRTTITLMCTAESKSYFGLPEVSTTLTQSFTLLGYAP